jgi:hypothetical protein
VIDPQTVMVGIPCHDGRTMAELTGMLVSCRDLFGAISMPTECSHPSLVRNIIADTFLRSPFQWLVGIDSDIVPARQDFEYLLQEIDIDANYEGEYGNSAPSSIPLPSRVEALCREALDNPHRTGEGLKLLADVLVCAEYAYKQDDFKPVQFGGGFYRAHRSVFSVLQQLKHADNGRVEVDQLALGQLFERIRQGGIADSATFALIDKLKETQTSQAGTPRLWQAQHGGRVFYDYYPSGPLLSQHVPSGDWKGEDHGFWTLCMLAGLVPRVERRTRLIHIGRKGYPYFGPDEIIPAHATPDGGNFQ